MTRNLRWLVFGFLLIFSGNFGQTFFIGLFGGEWRAAFGMSHGEFGTVYSTATLASAALLVWTGQLIDRVDLTRLVAGIAVILGAGILAAAAAPNILVLAIALFLLRHCGQGLMTHAGQTSMVRFFARGRGRATSIAGLGLPAGEAVLPGIAIAVTALYGWRASWFVAGALVITVMLPSLIVLSRGWRVHVVDDGHRQDTAVGREQEDAASAQLRHWALVEVLKDPRFYFALSGSLGLSFILTGFFIHQAHVADAKGWSLDLVAQAFAAYAVASVVTSLAVGVLIDRIGAKRLLPLIPAVLIGSMIVLATGESWFAAFAYMVLAGSAGGATMSLLTVVWAELYGTRHFGAVRAAVTALLVLASAVSPGIMGTLFDWGISVPSIAWASIAYLAVAGLAGWAALRPRRERRLSG